jgi:hypothetical protein
MTMPAYLKRQVRVTAVSVSLLVAAGGVASALCQYDECPQSERYWRNGDYGVFPGNNGSLVLNLYDSGQPVANSLTDSYGFELAAVTIHPTSGSTVDVFENGQ